MIRIPLGPFIGFVVFLSGGIFWFVQSGYSSSIDLIQTVPGTLRSKTSLPSAMPVTVLFGGDLQFDRYIREVMERRGSEFPFIPIQELLRATDLVVANLEGPITNYQSRSVGTEAGTHDNYVFTFPSKTAQVLKQEHIALVNIGNNHILNYGEDGVRQTKHFLEEAKVGYFGSPLIDDERYVIQTLQGVRIGFVNYNQFIKDGRAKALTDITDVRGKVDFVIVYAHWGTEYIPALESVKNLAHEFIDAGADLIIGSHPHVVQETEEYHGKKIYYSIGNFIFDQYFRSETQSGLLVQATLDPLQKKITTKDVSIQLKTNGQTVLSSPEE